MVFNGFLKIIGAQNQLQIAILRNLTFWEEKQKSFHIFGAPMIFSLTIFPSFLDMLVSL